MLLTVLHRPQYIFVIIVIVLTVQLLYNLILFDLVFQMLIIVFFVIVCHLVIFCCITLAFFNGSSRVLVSVYFADTWWERQLDAWLQWLSLSMPPLCTFVCSAMECTPTHVLHLCCTPLINHDMNHDTKEIVNIVCSHMTYAKP